MKRIILLLLSVFLLCTLVACDGNDNNVDDFKYPEYADSSSEASGVYYNTSNTKPAEDIDMSKVKAEIGAYKYSDFVVTDEVTDFVVIRVKGYGDIVAVLRPDVAPVTAENFKKLVKENFFDNLVFHRVYKGFMIQGGGMYADGSEKDADTIVGEFSSNGHTNNLSHEAGVLSMARTTVPDSASSQFFIMHEYSSFLDGNYAAFGYVLAGMDVVNSIAECKVTYSATMQENTDPVEDIIIKGAFFVRPLDSTKLGTRNEYVPCEHTYGEWTTTKAATCTETGTQERVCAKCQRVESATVKKAEHEYPAGWDSVKDPTCTEYGSLHRGCLNCDNIETQSLEKLPHNFEGGFCTVCDAYSYELEVGTEGNTVDTTVTGSGVDIDMLKVSEQIDAYEYTDFVKSDEVTDFVVIKVKDYGDVVIALREDVAPITAGNFKGLVSEGFYKDIVFHRVIKDFMIQGGYLTSDGGAKTADSIVGEFESNGHENNLKHIKGVISMARTSDPDSASSQLFIMHGDAPHLDGQYAAFGYVLAGLDVIDAIASCEVNNPTSSSPSPKTAVVIEDVLFVSPIDNTGIAK